MKGTREEHLSHIFQAVERHFTFTKILAGLRLRFDITEQDREYVHELVDHVLRIPSEISDKVTKPVTKPTAPTPKPKKVSEYDVGVVIGQLCDGSYRWSHRFPRKITIEEIRKALASPYLN
jgi:hypothetical protein